MAIAFVTGGSGFIGGHLIRALRQRGDEVHALARSSAAEAAVREAGARPALADLGDVHALRQAVQGANVVFHVAAKAEEWGSPRDFHQVNVVGTEHVLHAARRAGVPRVVHVSTEAVLHDGGPLIDADETHPYPDRPLGLYSKTKGQAERNVVAANGEELETVVVRPRFVWGPGDANLLPAFARAVRSKRWRWVGDGRHLTSTTHVANAVHGLLLAADRGRPGEIYFVTDGEPVEFRRMVTRLLAAVHLVPPEKRIGPGTARAAAAVSESIWSAFRLPGVPPVTRTAVAVLGQQCTVSDAKARRELRYEPVITRDDGFAQLERGG